MSGEYARKVEGPCFAPTRPPFLRTPSSNGKPIITKSPSSPVFGYINQHLLNSKKFLIPFFSTLGYDLTKSRIISSKIIQKFHNRFFSSLFNQLSTLGIETKRSNKLKNLRLPFERERHPQQLTQLHHILQDTSKMLLDRSYFMWKWIFFFGIIGVVFSLKFRPVVLWHGVCVV
jgi:hypothetical protein